MVAMPEGGISVTSHLRLLIPSHSSLLSNFRVQDEYTENIAYFKLRGAFL